MTGRPVHDDRRILPLAWIALVCIEVLTQLSLKFAGHATGAFDFSAQAFGLAVRCGWLWIAAASYCAGFLAWMLILQRSNLSRAYPTSAIVFVAMMAASFLVLHEPIGIVRIVGATLIVTGILQLGGKEPGEPLVAASEEPSPE
jgi:drug/metabolite transporter (DMT)-like permease